MDAEHPGVISVKPNTFHAVHTTRSWDFLGLGYDQPSGLLKKANYGEDVIVGIVDSGLIASVITMFYLADIACGIVDSGLSLTMF